VHHLLDADLVRELLSAIVVESSAGRWTLNDLFEEAPAAGNPATADWILATRDVPDAFASFLSRVVLAVVWRGDDVHLVEPDGLGADEADWARSLITALSLGTADFGFDPTLQGSGRTMGLAPYVTAMAEARQRVGSTASTRWLEQIEEATKDAPPLLGALFTKHVGDLLGDADCWGLALECYLQAGDRLIDDSIWEGAVVRTRQIVAQSVAMATWHRDGPEQAAALLEALVSESTVDGSPLPLLNAAFDLMNARAARGSFSTAWSARRPATYTAPLLLQSHNLEHALTYAATGRFKDSHRWFWAKLRRQTALGGTTAAWQTKGHYGRAVIDEVEASLGRELQPRSFAMGVRLLVESGRTELADATSWSERLVETYLTPTTLDELRDTTARSPGTRIERELVATSLRREWLLAIPADKVELARDMLADLASTARLGQHTGMSSTNTGGLSLKSLKIVATERPEFRGLIGPELVALVDRFRQSSGPRPMADAIEAAALFVDGIDKDSAEALCRKAAELVQDLPHDAFWPITRAASRLLDSDAASALSRQDEAFQRLRSAALVKLALNSASQHTSLLYLLRDIDPSAVREQIGAEELESVVNGIRARAREMSSSAATENIHALLVAPKVAGEAGVHEALDAIERILRSATSPRPSPSLQNGYEVLLLIARNGDKIADDLDTTLDLRARVRQLLSPLNDLWRSAASRPLIFAGFAVPPRSTPDRVTVHNWTFATLELLRWLGAGAELNEALETAAANHLLAEGMSTGRAVQGATSDAIDADAVAKERAEAFYAALGERLVAIGSRADQGAAASLRILLHRCLQLGPRGEDAALLLASRCLGITLDPNAASVNTYTAKLRRDANLRLSLSPLLRCVLDEAAARI
jgi:hypothetical protein